MRGHKFSFPVGRYVGTWLVTNLYSPDRRIPIIDQEPTDGSTGEFNSPFSP